jgi:hypothetical protein
MNLDFIVDQNHSYRRAIEIAYEKAKRDGGVDEATARECEFVISQQEPDYVYHEIKLDKTGRLHEDGCVSYRVLNPSDAYEHAKLNARRRAAECFADQMDDLWKDFKKTTVGVEPELSSELRFSIDEKGTIRPISTSRPLDAKAEKQLFEVLNNHSEFKVAAKEYVWLLAGLVGRTIEGLSAPYARHFVGSSSQEG